MNEFVVIGKDGREISWTRTTPPSEEERRLFGLSVKPKAQPKPSSPLAPKQQPAGKQTSVPDKFMDVIRGRNAGVITPDLPFPSAPVGPTSKLERETFQKASGKSVTQAKMRTPGTLEEAMAAWDRANIGKETRGFDVPESKRGARERYRLSVAQRLMPKESSFETFERTFKEDPQGAFQAHRKATERLQLINQQGQDPVGELAQFGSRVGNVVRETAMDAAPLMIPGVPAYTEDERQEVRDIAKGQKGLEDVAGQALLTAPIGGTIPRLAAQVGLGMAEDSTKPFAAGALDAQESAWGGLGGMAILRAGSKLLGPKLGPIFSSVPLGAKIGGNIVGQLGAAFLGAYGAEKASEAVQKANPAYGEWKGWLREEMSKNPELAGVGQVIGSLTPWKASPQKLSQLGQSLKQASKSGSVAEYFLSRHDEMENLIDVGLGGLIETGIEGARQVSAGQFDPLNLALATVSGFLYSEPGKLASKMGITPTDISAIQKSLDTTFFGKDFYETQAKLKDAGPFRMEERPEPLPIQPVQSNIAQLGTKTALQPMGQFTPREADAYDSGETPNLLGGLQEEPTKPVNEATQSESVQLEIADAPSRKPRQRRIGGDGITKVERLYSSLRSTYATDEPVIGDTWVDDKGNKLYVTKIENWESSLPDGLRSEKDRATIGTTITLGHNKFGAERKITVFGVKWAEPKPVNDRIVEPTETVEPASVRQADPVVQESAAVPENAVETPPVRPADEGVGVGAAGEAGKPTEMLGAALRGAGWDEQQVRGVLATVNPILEQNPGALFKVVDEIDPTGKLRQEIEHQVVSVDADSLSREVLSKIDRALKAKGYDTRGADDVLTLLKTRVARDGVLWHPDWIDAYQKATGGRANRIAKLEAKNARPNVRWDRIRALGSTSDLMEAGYIKPDGGLIDLSGKREGGPSGARALDHREAGGTAGMQELMAEGYIRMDHSSGSIDISKAPTPEQYRVIDKIASEHNGELVIDLNDGLGELRDTYYLNPERTFSREYPAGTRFARIRADIERFFSGEDPLPINKFLQESDGAVKGAYSPESRVIELVNGKADVSTVIHEVAHDWHGFLQGHPTHGPTIQRIYGGLDNVKGAERFARDFEKYLATGKSPVTGLQGVFDAFRKWMRDIYGKVFGENIPADARKIFDEAYANPSDETMRLVREFEEFTPPPPVEAHRGGDGAHRAPADEGVAGEHGKDPEAVPVPDNVATETPIAQPVTSPEPSPVADASQSTPRPEQALETSSVNEGVPGTPETSVEGDVGSTPTTSTSFTRPKTMPKTASGVMKEALKLSAWAEDNGHPSADDLTEAISTLEERLSEKPIRKDFDDAESFSDAKSEWDEDVKIAVQDVLDAYEVVLGGERPQPPTAIRTTAGDVLSAKSDTEAIDLVQRIGAEIGSRDQIGDTEYIAQTVRASEELMRIINESDSLSVAASALARMETLSPGVFSREAKAAFDSRFPTTSTTDTGTVEVASGLPLNRLVEKPIERGPTPDGGSVQIDDPQYGNRDWNVFHDLAQPVSVIDMNGNTISIGAFERVGGALGKQFSQHTQNAKHNYMMKKGEWESKIASVKELIERASGANRIPSFLFKKKKEVLKKAESDFIELLERPFDDPERMKVLASDTELGQALKIHDELTEEWRQYIIESRRALGFDVPENWGITDKGYFRHAFLDRVKVIVDGEVTYAANYADAQRIVVEALGKNPQADVMIRARIPNFGQNEAVQLSKKGFWRLVGRLSQSVQIDKAEILDDIKGVVKPKYSPIKFYGPLLQRKGAEGYSMEYGKIMEMTATQLARSMELSKWAKDVQPIIDRFRKNEGTPEALDPYHKPLLANAMDAYKHALWGTPTESEKKFGQLVRKVFPNAENPEFALREIADKVTSLQSMLTLRYNIRSSAANLFQTTRTLLPFTSAKEMARLTAKIIQDKDFREIIKHSGVVRDMSKLNESSLRTWAEPAEGVKRLLKTGSFGIASDFNRALGFAFGYEQAIKDGKDADAAVRNGLTWAEKVEFDNTVWNVQPVMRAPMHRVLLQFKSFAMKDFENFLSVIGKMPGDEKIPYAKTRRVTKWLAGLGLGAGVRVVDVVAKLFGIQLVVSAYQAVKEGLEENGMSPELADRFAAAWYLGAPAGLGANMSASLGLPWLEEWYGRTPWEKLGGFLAGPTAGKAIKVYENIQSGSLEKIPRTITPYAKTAEAIQSLVTGEPVQIKTGKDEYLDPALSVAETVAFALGFTPTRQALFYDFKDAGVGRFDLPDDVASRMREAGYDDPNRSMSSVPDSVPKEKRTEYRKRLMEEFIKAAQTLKTEDEFRDTRAEVGKRVRQEMGLEKKKDEPFYRFR